MNRQMIIKTTLALLLSSTLYSAQSTKVNENSSYTATVVPKKMSVQEKNSVFVILLFLL